MKKYLLIFAVITAFLVSCEKENEILETTSIENEVETVAIDGIEVESENGYLVLKDFDDAELLATVLINISDEEIADFGQKRGFISAYVYRKNQNDKALRSTDDTTMQTVLEELKSKDYLDCENNSLTYPFANEQWANILNEDGVIKINNKLMRFWKNDQICSKTNNLKTLIDAKSIEDFKDSEFQIFKTSCSPSLKSIGVPLTSGALFNYTFIKINTVGGRDYRRKTQLYSVIYRYGADEVALHTIYVRHSLSQKIGVWWDYKDYLYYRLFDLTIGGNPKSSDSSFGNHVYTDVHHNYPGTSGGLLQKSEHNIVVYNHSFYPYISDYLTPEFDMFSYEYWTNKVPEKSWMVF